MREGQEDGPERRVWPAEPQDIRSVGARSICRECGDRGVSVPAPPQLTAPSSPPPLGSSIPMGQGGWAGGFEGISLPAWTSNTTRGMWKCGCPRPSLWSLALPVPHVLAVSPTLLSAT